MRQLKGKPKENAKEKKERKKEFSENRDKAMTVALPILGACFVLILMLVYSATRPKAMEGDF